MPHVTISEIARLAGVSSSAVSYALNGRPGVSETTRAKIVKVADSLGWAPNTAARMLSGAKTETFGLVFHRPARALSVEQFYMDFLAGLEAALGERQYALLLQVVPNLEKEAATYKHWWATRRVDGIVALNLRVDDSRIPLLTELGMPAILVGDPSMTGPLTSVWVDYSSAMSHAVRYLVDLGHRRIARVAGFTPIGHVKVRDTAFDRAIADAGLTARTLHTDFSGEDGARATRALLNDSPRPTAIVYDNDVMAVAGLSVAAQSGLRVPHDITLLGWDDSPLCEITNPPLSAMSQDNVGLGGFVARQLFGLLEGEEPAAHLYSTPTLRLRGSTAPPPH
ncbi:LacI family transcriptional regulator [Phytoactinopolyspora alkaliphila]|uniref:LacI family transcriptional regulator n=1 Tax=Phytoactinopolyspora alkaliphila TaxID=1783498 RepID=A0A6N9YPL0_9ACTN|nr:LacI family transcriptional regulator [Phytoactinopolyspora alkaliphila]